MSYRCETCGQSHDALPHVGADVPYSWQVLTEAERAESGGCDTDLCVIGADCFIRGVIEIPVHDHPDGFGFGVWVSQKRENYEAYAAHPDTSAIGPFFGWLSTRIAYYEADTLNLKTTAHFVGGGQRPRIVLHADETHPLAAAQREGITLAQAWDIVHFYLPPAKPKARKQR